MVPHILGVDQSKSSFDVCLMHDRQQRKRKFPNTPSGFEALSVWLKKQDVPKVHLAVESTGRLPDALVAYMHNHGHDVSIVNPARVAAHRVARGWKNKTDKLDAVVIADYLIANLDKARLWEPVSVDLYVLRDVVGQIVMMKKHRGAYSNRAGCGLRCEEVLDLNRRLAGSSEAEIKALTERAEAMVAADAGLARRHAILLTVPGIGRETALTLTALIDFNAFRTGRDLAVFLGLASNNSQSGETEYRSKVSREGNSELKALLKLGAVSAKRGFFKHFAERLKQKGKGKATVNNAVARKMILIAHACVRKNVLFDPTYVYSAA